MDEWHDAPVWLIDLAVGGWGPHEWRAWEEVWKPELGRRGIKPEMLEPIGDPSRPLAISVDPPGRRWCSGKIRWDVDGDTAILEALRRLVQDLDGAGVQRGAG
jgi:hypothetical protein